MPVISKDADVDGKDHYARIYQERMASEARWLAFGAGGKADTVQHFLERRGLKPARLLELGAGTGAVIAECQRRGLAEEYWAVDYSAPAIEHLRATAPGVHAVVADVTAADALPAQHFDVVVLSHVIEHVEEPSRLLAAVKRLDADYCIFEVPLDDLPAERIKSLFRDRSRNAAGHVQFFTGRTFEQLIRDNGFEILDRRRYVPFAPLAALRLQRQNDGWGLLRFLQAVLTGNVLPRLLRPIWSRLYYAYYATLCRSVS